MKDYKFYEKYANIPLNKRYDVLTYDSSSPISGMTLCGVYKKIKDIDEKTRQDLIRKEELLESVERFLE
jgi:hypothetical protein